MSERFPPPDDPVLEEVLDWTVTRDASDIRQLLEWLPKAKSMKERKALLNKVHLLLSEMENALNELDILH